MNEMRGVSLTAAASPVAMTCGTVAAPFSGARQVPQDEKGDEYVLDETVADGQEDRIQEEGGCGQPESPSPPLLPGRSGRTARSTTVSRARTAASFSSAHTTCAVVVLGSHASGTKASAANGGYVKRSPRVDCE